MPPNSERHRNNSHPLQHPISPNINSIQTSRRLYHGKYHGCLMENIMVVSRKIIILVVSWNLGCLNVLEVWGAQSSAPINSNTVSRGRLNPIRMRNTPNFVFQRPRAWTWQNTLGILKIGTLLSVKISKPTKTTLVYWTKYLRSAGHHFRQLPPQYQAPNRSPRSGHDPSFNKNTSLCEESRLGDRAVWNGRSKAREIRCSIFLKIAFWNFSNLQFAFFVSCCCELAFCIFKPRSN